MPGFPVIPERLYRESRTETGSLLDSRLQHAGMTSRGVVGMTGCGGVGMKEPACSDSDSMTLNLNPA